jgi:hypothetical protein
MAVEDRRCPSASPTGRSAALRVEPPTASQAEPAAANAAAFTEGPWRIEPQGEGARGHWLHDDSGEYVALVCRRDDRAEEDANANLIVTAGDLFRALEAMTRAFSPHPREDTEGWREEHEAFEDARAALAKAKGEPQICPN